MGWVGQKKYKKCPELDQAQFRIACYHSRLGSFPDTHGSLPNADLPCQNLLPKSHAGRLFQSQMGLDYFLGDILYFPSGQKEGMMTAYLFGAERVQVGSLT